MRKRFSIRKSLTLVLGIAGVGVLLTSCDLWDSVFSRQAAAPPPEFACPDSFADLIPVESIPVTVRAGRLARGNGHIKVPWKGGVNPDSVFDNPAQRRHPDPEIRVTEDGRFVELIVTGHPGRGETADTTGRAVDAGKADTAQNASRDPFTRTVSLPRCTPDEGNLIRIHIDGTEQGIEGVGNSKITVTGVYDRMTSEAALEDQAYGCKICRRVEVCSAEPPDCR